MLCFMLRDYAEKRGSVLNGKNALRGAEMISAGIMQGGKKLNALAAEVLFARGIKFDADFCSVQADKDTIGSADAVLAMEDAQKREIEDICPNVKNLHSMSEFCGKDVLDPYGQSREAYETVADIFAAALPKIEEMLDALKF
jgi:protein-tyrosine-phosphatase